MELRRTLKRKALSDCTNTTANTNTTATVTQQPSSAKPPLTRPSKRPLSSRNSDENPNKYDTSTGSNNAENPRFCNNSEKNPRIVVNQPSTPPRPKTTAGSVDVDRERSGFATVYSRRQPVDKTKSKGKSIEAIEPFSCPPAVRRKSVGFQLDKENIDDDVSKSCTAAHPKAKKRRFSLPLPQDFIDKQKAYFAEVDAFELQEEVASEGESE